MKSAKLLECAYPLMAVCEPVPIVLYPSPNIFINSRQPFPPSPPYRTPINIYPLIVQKVQTLDYFFAMPAIRPTLEYKYQHREFRQKLIIPYGRLIPHGFGPQFKPTRSIYNEQTDKPENIRRILLQRRRVDGKVPSPFPFSLLNAIDNENTDNALRRPHNC